MGAVNVRALALGHRAYHVVAGETRPPELVVAAKQRGALLDVGVVHQRALEADRRCLIRPHLTPHPHVAVLAHGVAQRGVEPLGHATSDAAAHVSAAAAVAQPLRPGHGSVDTP